MQEAPEWALRPKDYAYFLKGLFDLWYRDWKNGSYISIRNFDDCIHLLCGQSPSSCAASGECGGYLVIENDGSVYPCDFYVENTWCLGNLSDTSIEELLSGKKMQTFLSESRKYRENSRCTACNYYMLCRGGCRHDWIFTQQNPEQQTNYFCEAYQDFYRYAMSRLLEIAQAERMALLRP